MKYCLMFCQRPEWRGEKEGRFLKMRILLRVQDGWGPEMWPLDWWSWLRSSSLSFSPFAKLSLSWQSERVHKSAGLKCKCLPAVMGSSPLGKWMCVVLKCMYISIWNANRNTVQTIFCCGSRQCACVFVRGAVLIINLPLKEQKFPCKNIKTYRSTIPFSQLPGLF